MSTEMQGRVVWMCRARGFKDHGEYEVVKGLRLKSWAIPSPPYLTPMPILKRAF